MDDFLAGKTVCRCNLGIPCLTAIKSVALENEIRTCCTMDRSINATTAQQGLVGCVDNAVHFELGDVIPDDSNSIIKNLRGFADMWRQRRV